MSYPSLCSARGIGTIATALGEIVLLLNCKQAANKTANEKRLAESRLAAEQFMKATELLGNENVHIRI